MDPDPLLEQSQPLVGVVDYRGRPIVSRTLSGRWRAAIFVLGLEIILRFAYYGISSNLISYLTESLGQSNASAAAAINAWSGTSSMLPLLGAFLADSFLGRYRTIVISLLLYIIGYAMLSLSAVLPYMRPPTCTGSDTANCQPSSFRISFFYISLYLVAFAQGGDTPCGAAFGADQFDQNDPKECISRSSFFNWSYFCNAVGISVGVVVLSYVEDNVGWGLGFGIPCLIMVVSLIVFLAGSRRYRLYNPSGRSPFVWITDSFVLLLRSWCAGYVHVEACHEEIETNYNTRSFIMEESRCEDSTGRHIEEAKVLKLLPIWATCLIYGTVFAQISTLFNKQAKTLDRSITSSLELPPAAIQSVGSMAILAFVPIYDRILVPVARKFTQHSTGITMLQRIGIGMVISILTVVVSALVETKRLNTARDFDLIDQLNATIPMSWWWMVPQYLLIGIGDVFTIVGLQEFFYDQMPIHFRSLGLALYLSVLGIGSFISSILISFIDKITSENGDSWFSNNLNRAHLDYFYWLLAFLSVVEFVLFLYFAKGYVYKKKCL